MIHKNTPAVLKYLFISTVTLLLLSALPIAYMILSLPGSTILSDMIEGPAFLVIDHLIAYLDYVAVILFGGAIYQIIRGGFKENKKLMIIILVLLFLSAPLLLLDTLFGISIFGPLETFH